MADRPAFDPTGYESPELAELNRPHHAIAWDLIEAERAVDAARRAFAPKAVYDPLFTVYIAAREAHERCLTQLDIEVAAYCARVEAAGGLDAYLGRTEEADTSQAELEL